MNYDATKAWDENIAETMEKLTDACREHKIPFIMFAAVKNDETSTNYVYDGLSPEDAGLKLYDDKITNRLNTIRNYVDNGVITNDAEPMDDMFKE